MTMPKHLQWELELKRLHEMEPPAPFNPDFDPNHKKWWPKYIEKVQELIQALAAAGVCRADAARAIDPYRDELAQEAKALIGLA